MAAKNFTQKIWQYHKESGLHSLGELKARLAVRRYTSTDYYWITNRFAINEDLS